MSQSVPSAKMEATTAARRIARRDLLWREAKGKPRPDEWVLWLATLGVLALGIVWDLNSSSMIAPFLLAIVLVALRFNRQHAAVIALMQEFEAELNEHQNSFTAPD